VTLPTFAFCSTIESLVLDVVEKCHPVDPDSEEAHLNTSYMTTTLVSGTCTPLSSVGWS
jgi:hypothetical protein